VPGAGSVPGASSLPADLTAAAVREVDLPTQRPPRRSREEVTDWLEEFAPVADPTEDDDESEPADTPTGEATEAESDADATESDAADATPAPTSKPAAGLADAAPPDFETMVPGVEYQPRSGQPRGAIDWNAPLVWSGDEIAQTPEPTTTTSGAAAAPLPPPTPAPVPPAPAPAAAKDPDPAPADPESGNDVTDWPEPPVLDADGLPVSSLRPAVEPVAWGWAAAWPNGGPAEWHTQSLPAVADVPAPADTPLPVPTPTAQAPAAPVQDLPGDEHAAIATAAVAEPANDTVAFDVPTTDPSLDEVTTSDEPIATADTAPEPATPDPVSAPEPPAIAEQVDESAPEPDPTPVPEPDVDQNASAAESDGDDLHVAWAEDIPPVDERPAPPALPSSPRTVAPQEWNEALSDDVPSPPSDWYGSVGAGPSRPSSPFGAPDVQPPSSDADLPTTATQPVPTVAGIGSEAGAAVDESVQANSPFPSPTPFDPHVRPPLPGANAPRTVGTGPTERARPFADPSAGPIPGWDSARVPGLQDQDDVAVQSSSSPLPHTAGAGGSLGSAYGGSTQTADVPKTGFDLDSPPEGFNESLRANPATRLLIEWVPLLLGAFLLAMIVRLFAFQAYYIPSGSMIPTLAIQDRVLVNKLSYDFHDVNRGDIVVFKRPEGTTGDVDDLIKRVIGLSGETVVFQNGNVFVDGRLVQESYLAQQDSTFPIDGIPGCVPAGTATECTVPSDHVLVLGDNRQSSTDGRIFGPIPEDTIVGRAFVRVWPLSNIGLL